MTPRLSVIISAGPCPPLLEGCLRSLSYQSLPARDYEVLLVVDSGAPHWLRELSLPYYLKIVEHPDRGPAAARNRGALESQGSVLLFLDGESEAAPRFLEAHWNAHQSAGRAVVIGYSPTPASQKKGIACAERGRSDRYFDEIAEPSHRFTFQDFSAVNVSLSVALFRAVGGFDERMSAGAEDYDLGARLLKQRARFQFAAEALCVRQGGPSCEPRAARGPAEGAPFAALVEKHIELFWKLLYSVEAFERTPARWKRSRYPEGENAYWSAVRARLGSFDRWEDLFEDAPLAPEYPREIEIAIPEDLPRLNEIFATQEVDSVNVVCGGSPLGRIAPEAGGGALSAAYVREHIETRFSQVLLGLAVAQRSGRKGSGAAVAGERFTAVPPADAPDTGTADEPFSWTPAAMVGTRIAEFDLARPTHIWGLEDAKALYLLVRNNGLPMAIHRARLLNQSALAKEEVLTMIRMGALPAPPLRERRDDLPPISVVVCTRSRSHALNRCLAALVRSPYPEFEVVVIDYGREPVEIAARFASPALRVVRADAPGIETARNRGAAESRYDIIAYIDETAVADPEWLGAIGAAFREPEIDAVTGLVLPAELSYTAQHLYEQFGPAPRNLFRTIFDGALKSTRDKIATHEIGTGSNMAFRRSALKRSGGFNIIFERIAARRTSGELDLFHRILTAGMKICYEPGAFVWQRYPRSERRQMEEFQDWRRGFGFYLLNLFTTGSIPRKTLLASIWREWFGALQRIGTGLRLRNPALRRTGFAELRGSADSLRAYLSSRQRVKRK